ncbi:MAG: hypothetical protein RL653_2685, partial [Pseudomonadota bacterium]
MGLPLARRALRLRVLSSVLLALLLAVAGALHAASRSLPAATPAIVLDGQFHDWAQVFAQPAQVSTDGNASVTGAGCHPTNPDRDCVSVSGRGRDVVRVASTWDASHLYFYVARSADYEKITHCAFVLDLDADGVAEATDRVLDVTWNGGGATTLKGVDLLDYVPALSTGDSLACTDRALCPAPGDLGLVDGYTLRGTTGSLRWSEANVPGAASSGDRFEVRVPWSALGIAAGSPLLWHLAVAQDGKVSSAVDNVGAADGTVGRVGVFAVELTPDRESAGANSGQVRHCHVLQNRGQFRDRYNLFAASVAGSGVTFHPDLGNCTPGATVAEDANGDGDFDDPGDTRASAAWDGDGDGRPDVELARGATSSWVVTVHLPAALDGAVESTTVRAQSVLVPSVTARALDTTRVGPAAIGPDVHGAAATPGAEAQLGPFALSNTSPSAFAPSLEVLGAPGWSRTLRADASGSPGSILATDADGNGAWDGPGFSGPGTVGAGQAFRFWVVLGVPAGAALNSNATVELRAAAPSAPRAPGRAWATVKVLPTLTLEPEYAAPDGTLPALPGTVLFFPHRLVNAHPQEDSITLRTGTPLPAGFVQRWFTDPNADGNPSDGALVSGPLRVAGNGGALSLVTALHLPEAGMPTAGSASTVATGLRGNVSVQEAWTLSSLVTSRDPLGALPAVRFPPCASVSVQALNLVPNSTLGYVLRRLDPSGAPVDAVALVTDRQGTATATFASWGGAPAGTWQLRLEFNGTPLHEARYTVEDGAAVSVEALPETDTGSALLLGLRMDWPGRSGLLAESAVHLEILDPFLAPVRTLEVPVPELTTRQLRVGWGAQAGVAFPSFGRHTARATWRSSCGGVLAEAAAQFAVPPWAPTLVAPGSGAFVSTSTPVFEGTALGGSTVELTVDGRKVASVLGAQWSHAGPALSEGPHTWTAVQSLLGAVSAPAPERTFTVDTHPPSSRVLAPTTGAQLPPRSLALGGDATDGTSGVSRVELSVNGGTWFAAQGTTTWSATFVPPSDGSYRISSRAIDRAGNVEVPSAGVTVVIDGTPPETEWEAVPPASSALAFADVAFRANEPTTGFACSLDGAPFTPCASPRRLGPLSEGRHAFEVRATDTTGNVEPEPAVHAWNVDTVTPTLQWVSHPAALTNVRTATVEFSASESTSGWECALDGTGFSTCSSPRTWTGLPDGAHAVRVRAKDLAGNAGNELTWTWTVDGTPPSSSVTSPLQGAALRSGPVEVEGRAEDLGSGLARVEYSVDAGPWLPAAGLDPWTFSVTVSSEGIHALRVRATDAAGNVQAVPASTWITWDTVAPDTLLVLTPPPLSREARATFAFTSPESAATFECSVEGGAWTPCTSPFTRESLSEGSHGMEIRARDPAGNVDLTPAAHAWTVDTVAPQLSFSSAPPPLTASPGLAVAFHSSEPATSRCSLDGGPAFSCTSPWSLDDLSHGDHVLEITATDTAGNVGQPLSARWRVDLVPPLVTITQSPPAHSSSTTDLVAFTLSEPSAVECSVDARPFVACTSPLPVSGLSDGPHQVEIRARDDAGNLGPLAVVRYEVDTAAPSTRFLSTPAPVDPASSAAFEFSASEPGATFTCQLDGSAVRIPCASPATFTALSDGSHALSVYARDAAGNEDPVGAHWSWTVDTSLPDTLVLEGPPGWSNQDVAVLLVASTAPDAHWECALDGAPFTACGPTVVFSELSEGPHLLEVRARNAAGTVDPSPARHAWTVDLSPPAAPQFHPVASSTPTPGLSGTAEPGTTVTWTLDGLPLAAAPVDDSGRFGGTPRTPLSEGPHLLEGFAVDAAGNAGPASARTFFTDTVPPAVTFVSGPGAASASPEGGFAFTVEDARPSSASCRLDGGPWAPCTSPLQVTSLGHGAHALEVRATDDSGNVGDVASWTWNVDLQPPDLHFTRVPPPVTSARTASIDVSSGEAVTLTCTLDGRPWAPCQAQNVLADLPDGAHAFSAQAVDAAGNVSPERTHAWTVDGAPPLARITRAPAPVTSEASALFEFESDESGCAFLCVLDGAPGQPCMPPWSSPPLADGPHALEVSAVDAAGNVSAPARTTWRVDTQPPLVTLASAPAALSARREDHFSFETSEPAELRCTLDGASVACASELDVGPLQDGPHELSVQAQDAAGNLGPAARWSWQVDGTAPAGPTLEPLPAADPQPVLSGHAEPGSTVEISVDGTWIGTAVADGEGHFSLQIPTPLPDGLHTVEAVASDPAGNAGPVAVTSVLTDTHAPSALFTQAPAALASSSSADFAFASDEPARFECARDGAIPAPCGPFHREEPLADGPHVLLLRAVDDAGNRGPDIQHAWTVDTTAPRLVLESAPAPRIRTSGATVLYRPTEPLRTAHCTLDGQPMVDCSSPLVLGGLSEGPHALVLGAEDLAGNPSPALAITWIQDTLPPTVTVLAAPAALTQSANSVLAFSPSEPAEVRCSLDGAAAQPCASPVLVGPSSDGAHVMVLSAVDTAGNEGPATQVAWTVDRTAPASPILAPLSSREPALPISGTAEPGASVSVHVDGHAVGTVQADPSGHFSLVLPAPLAEGPHVITAIATDAAGNQGLPAQQAVLTDTVPPTVTITFGPPPRFGQPTAAFRFVSSETVTFSCSVDGQASTPCTSPFLVGPLADGPHSLSVYGVDVVGNAGPEDTWRWTCDSQLPVVQWTQTPASLERTPEAVFTWVSSEPAVHRCALDG